MFCRNLLPSSTLKMGAVGFSETLVLIDQTTWCHIPKDYNLHIHCYENLRCHMKCLTISKAVCQQVSAWGGYVFIINLIPLHVFTLLVMGRYSNRLFTSYTTFYILGLLLSMQIPFVGFQPIRTSEHMAASGNVFKSDNACLQVTCCGNMSTVQMMCSQ
jgi:hypothetical protein